MASQILVNVLRVPAVGDLASAASVTIDPGLFSNAMAVVPTLIQPDRGTPIIVDTGSPITETAVTFRNDGVAPAHAYFRFERGVSVEVDADTLVTSYWQGVSASGGGGFAAVNATAPIASSNPGGPTTTISLNNSGVTAATYGNAAATPESVMPSFTVDSHGLITSAAQNAITIGGSAAKTYVDTAAATAQANAEAYAQSLAFGIGSKQPAHVATTVALPAYGATPTVLTASVNGAFPLIDGQTVLVGERVLVKDESGANDPNNGIYELTQAGDGLNPWILTRTADANTAQELCGSLVTVETGPVNAGTLWLFSANALTFVLGTTPVIWDSITFPNATTLVPGAVQLAGGLGGAGTVYTSPKLDVDSANVTSGTLPRVRGGTGLSAAGAAGNVLTSDGTNWTSSPVPTPAVSIAKTYYVTTTGGVAPAADGSITEPFNNIQDAIDQASSDYPGGDAVAVIVAPGSYTGNVTVDRKNVFFQGAGCRPEDNQATQIIGTVTFNLAGIGSVYNDQISFDGFFFNGVNDRAVFITGTTQFSPTFTNCYFTTTGSSTPLVIHCLNPNIRATFTDCYIIGPTVGVVGITYAISWLNGLLRMSNCQITANAADPQAIVVQGNGVVFFDRVILDSSAATASFAISFQQSADPTTAPWASSIGAACLTIVNSSIGVPNGIIAISSIAAPLPVLAAFFANNFFNLNNGNITITGFSPYIAYNNTYLDPTDSNAITGGIQVDTAEVLSSTKIVSPYVTSSNKPVRVNSAGYLSTGTILATEGGTGITTYATGDLVYAGSVNPSVLSKLTIGSAGQVLTVSGGLPVWATATATPIGPAGGILTGTYPNPTGLIGPSIASEIPLNPYSGVGYVSIRTAAANGASPATTTGFYGSNNSTGQGGATLIRGGLSSGGLGGAASIIGGTGATNGGSSSVEGGEGAVTGGQAAVVGGQVSGGAGAGPSGLVINGSNSTTSGGISLYSGTTNATSTGFITISVGTRSGTGGSSGLLSLVGGDASTSGQTPGGVVIRAGRNTVDLNYGTISYTASTHTFTGSVVIGGTTYPTTAVATGDIFYASAAGTLSKLPAGSNGQVLTLAAGIPSWATAATGSAATGAYVAKIANYTATSNDYCINCTTNSFTVTLPPAATAAAGRIYVIKNSGTGVITVDGDAAETIDGALTYTLGVQYSSITVMSTGTSWIII